MSNVTPVNEEAKLNNLLSLLQDKVKFKIGSKSIKLDDSLNKVKKGTTKSQPSEKAGNLLEWFTTHYQKERKFNSHVHKDLFSNLFHALLKAKNLQILSSPENNLRVVICLRMLMRDLFFQQNFAESEDLAYFADMFFMKSKGYLMCTEEPFVVDIVANLASIFHKISHSSHKFVLLNHSIPQTMLHLLRASDVFILHCSLNVLVALGESKILRNLISNMHSVECICQIIQEFDDVSKCYAANLMRILCSDNEIREQMMIYDTLPVLLSILNDGEQCVLLWHVVWTLVKLCNDTEHANEIRLLGGIPLLLNLLHKDRPLTCSRYELSSGCAKRGQSNFTVTSKENKEEVAENKLKLHSACCAALTELALDDRCTQTIVQTNGVYVIAKLIFPQKPSDRCKGGVLNVQKNAFRALRFLFSMERNRKMFKRIFPPEMFQKFIDIGHYVRDIEAYTVLVELLNSMQPCAIDIIREAVEELNQNKTPKRWIRDYAIYDILGTGAFGSVYRVKKRSTQTPLAMKEVSIAGGQGKTGKEKQKREIDEIVRELSIIREQLRHPNVVRYYSTFQENDKLYIEMELIEGASLQEHFTSLKEKNEKGMGEIRVWRVFIQMCLGLRYLHCDKRIVHRDLTPNNVMLGENDKVTITDFGLAKQKKDSSKMVSVVGTLLYSCPEIVKSEPYGDKADIWALGCILQQMATLDPPFNASNMLSLATKIVDAVYDPIPESWGYSSLVRNTVKSCLTIKPEDRPDIVAVSGIISEPMLRYTDHVASLHMAAEKRIEKERRRTQKHFHEARRNRQDYQTLFQASQESNERSSRTFEMSSESVSSHTPTSETSSRIPSDDLDVFIADNGNDEVYDSSGLDSSGGISSTSSSSGQDKSSPVRTNKKIRPVSAGTKIPHPPSPDVKALAPRRALSFDLTGARNNNNNSDRSISSSQMSIPKDLSRGFSARSGRPMSSGGKSAAMLSISPSKLRPISDPVQQTLIQLHKIIYIDQLPPTNEVNYRRRIISRYKRALFSPHSRSMGLKDELKKLLCGSHETIDLSFIVEAPSLTQKATAEAEAKELLGNCYVSTVTDGGKLYEEGITYAQMQTIIERVLTESGYYDLNNKPKNVYADVRHRCRTLPEDMHSGANIT
ncbi:unnamed protein product [Clavelina lepadiformis]|uniref:Protein kinase domain-containing protein n=1 Tax=Clavelina lepadiformis TaxID=159417 RepID=A0ABP0FUM4_CLALP